MYKTLSIFGQDTPFFGEYTFGDSSALSASAATSATTAPLNKCSGVEFSYSKFAKLCGGTSHITMDTRFAGGYKKRQGHFVMKEY
jgi:hypothetical protein